MESTKSNADDIYEFKSIKEQTESVPDNKTDSADANNETSDTSNAQPTQTEDSQKRNFAEVADTTEDSGNDEETKRKKRKDETGKDVKSSAPQRTGNPVKGQTNKQTAVVQNKLNLLNATKNGKTYSFNNLHYVIFINSKYR